MIKGILLNLNPFSKLLLVFLMVLGSSLFVTLLFIFASIPFTGMDEFNSLLTGGVSVPYLKYLQIVQGVSVFIIPSVLLAWLFSLKPWIWLGFRPVNAVVIIASAFLLIICQPLVTFLAEINSGLNLPEALNPIESWMQNAEESASQLIFQFLDTREPVSILVNVFMIVLIPALGEEMLFRGTIQPVIKDLTKSQHLAVWITAFLFSAFHMQFFTFLPRLLLGIILGYLLVYGKNIWYSITGHFVNNLLSLAIFYYYRFTKPEINPMDAGEAGYPTWMIVLSIIFVSGLILFIKEKVKNNYSNETSHAERLDTQEYDY